MSAGALAKEGAVRRRDEPTNGIIYWAAPNFAEATMGKLSGLRLVEPYGSEIARALPSANEKIWTCEKTSLELPSQWAT